ncbi:hypothetical protein KY289_013508 [Solanum tuberosum]|nr:hypothetical protein KY289_013508 [Solanum tuberosum]
MTEYEARFYELSRHAIPIVPDEAERVYRFVRGFSFSVRSCVFRAAREGASFQYIVNIADEAKFMVLEEFVETKRGRSSHHFWVPYLEVESQGGHGSPSGPQLSYSDTPSRDSAPPSRGLGRGKSGKGSTTSGRGANFVGRRRPEAETSDVVITDFDITLGMDWLSLHHVILDYYAKTMTLAMLGVLRIEWTGVSGSYPSKVNLAKLPKSRWVHSKATLQGTTPK